MLSLATPDYDNIKVGDLNINVSNQKICENEVSDICDICDLSNLIKAKTCFKSEKETTLAVMLTNNPRSSHKSEGAITGLSDCHKMIMTCLKSKFQGSLQK